MISRLPQVSLFFLAALATATPALAARAAADLHPPQRRQAAVDTATRLIHREPAPEFPADLPSPFNPAAFEEPDPDAAKAAAALAAASGNTVAAPAGPASDREILETLAQKLTPSGTFIYGGTPLLIIDRNRFEIGTRFIVTYNEQDYELQLVSINRTTFTLRYRGEELTRPIKPAK